MYVAEMTRRQRQLGRSRRSLMRTGTIALAASLVIVGVSFAQDDVDEEEMLDPIVVTATRTETSFSVAPGAITLVGRDDIEAAAAVDLGGVLAGVEGLDVIRYGGPGSSTSVHMRGSFGVHSLVLVDGSRQNSPSLGGAEISAISPIFLDRVEIVRGPASALYGTGAIGGVIHALTREVPTERVSESMISLGSFGTVSTSFLEGIPLGTGGALVGLGIFRSDGHRPNSDYERQELFGKVGLGAPETGMTEFTLHLQESRVGWPGPKPAGGGEVSSLDHFGESAVGSLQAEYARGPFRLRTSIKQKTSTSHRWSVEERTTTTPELDVSGSWNPLPWLKTTVGADAIHDCYSVDGPMPYETERTTGSAWADAEMDGGPWRGAIGLRWDEPSDYAGRGSVRAAVSRTWGEGFRLETGIGTGFRAPALDDLYYPFDGYSEGNPDLKPETSLEAEIVLKRSVPGTDGPELMASIFSKRIDDMIVWSPGAASVWRPENLTTADIRGLEFSGSVPLRGGFEGKVAYAYLDGEETRVRPTLGTLSDPSDLWSTRTYSNFVTSTGDLSNTPDHQLSLGVDWSRERPSGRVSAGIALRWVSEVSKDYEESITLADVHPVTGDFSVNYVTKELARHWLLDARLAWSWENGEVFVRLDNILDEEYSRQFGFSFDDLDYPMPGRSVTVGARLDF